MTKTAIIYGLGLAVLLLVLKTLEYKWLLQDISWQLYGLFIAVFFTALGLWLSGHLWPKKTTQDPFQVNHQAIQSLQLSERELAVLQKLAAGLSNQAIADELFVSINTVKTHLKNGFSKLEVNNRLQAINKLKALNIIEK
ncbi:response regulator transcription factor [Marinicella meishanensis]|uniref:response regulator transcription factor n=1 Tax=Marinicella meishanensis TaxID=2873263 RepID=UPI00272DE429|nr:LuxR C-terminal-related transcriptional regulator [Marinicella sp. NBU2979]